MLFVCCLQPRRISAISVAERVAYERVEEVGESTGYSVRFESVFPRHYGSIFFCTVGKLGSEVCVSVLVCVCAHCNVCLLVRSAGVLLRKLVNGLVGVSHVIIDEIHERDINVRAFALSAFFACLSTASINWSTLFAFRRTSCWW